MFSMATSVQLKWARRLRTLAGAVVVLGVLAYVMVQGISILSRVFAPGLWGYLGAVGFRKTMSSPPPLVR